MRTGHVYRAVELHNRIQRIRTLLARCEAEMDSMLAGFTDEETDEFVGQTANDSALN